jgi:hypothetical protein
MIANELTITVPTRKRLNDIYYNIRKQLKHDEDYNNKRIIIEVDYDDEGVNNKLRLYTTNSSIRLPQIKYY